MWTRFIFVCLVLCGCLFWVNYAETQNRAVRDLLLNRSSRDAALQTTYNCKLYDTTVFTGNLGAKILSDCVIDPSPNGALLIQLTGEVTCGALSDATLSMFAGTTQVATGANFIGHIGPSSNVLTVDSWIAPAPTSPFTIATGQYLFDGQSGAGIPGTGVLGSQVTVTGVTDATHFTVSSSLTVASEPMWSLPTYAFELGPPSTANVSFIQELTACNDGTTQLMSLTGNTYVNEIGMTFPLWIHITMTTEFRAGGPSQSGSLRNAQLTMIPIK